MIVPEERTLLKNKPFVILLLFGILLSLAGVILRGVDNEKATSQVCATGTCFGDPYCYQHGNAYCCGSPIGIETCGGQTSCLYIGQDCSGYLIAGWVLSAVSVVVMFALIVIAKRHRLSTYRMELDNMARRHNAIVNPDSQGMNASLSDEYQRV